MDKILLGDLCLPASKNIKLASTDLIDYVDISSVDNQAKFITGYTTYEYQDAPSRARKSVSIGDVIISTVRPNLNAVAVFDITTPNTPVVSTGFCVLSCRDDVNPRYVYYACQSREFIRQLVSQATGASYPAVNDKIIRNALIPNYTLSSQNFICDQLDSVQNLINIKKKENKIFNETIKARFVEMFGDPVHNTSNLPALPMTEVCEIIDGDRGKNYPKQEDFFDEEYCLFLNAKNVTNHGFDFSECMFVTKEKDESLRKGKLKRGDVVLTTRGTLGNLAFYTDAVPFENVRINSGMVILRMNKQIIDEGFFIEQFRMQVDDIKKTIASGSAQPQLPISTMNKISVIMPAIKEQKLFSNFVAQVDKSKSVNDRILDRLQKTKASLMQEYFG